MQEMIVDKPRYLLNSAVVTSPGTWMYCHISLEIFMTMLSNSEWKSFIGFRQTAKAIEEITGHAVDVNRTRCDIQPGESAMVFRLQFPPGTPRNEEGGLPIDFLIENSEIGLLKRIS